MSGSERAWYLGLTDQPDAVVMTFATIVAQPGAGIAKGQIVAGQIKIREPVAVGKDRPLGGLDAHGYGTLGSDKV